MQTESTPPMQMAGTEQHVMYPSAFGSGEPARRSRSTYQPQHLLLTWPRKIFLFNFLRRLPAIANRSDRARDRPDSDWFRQNDRNR